MAKTWFRVHADGPASITRNKKIQTLSPGLVKWLLNLWAFGCRNEGCLPSFEDIAWELHSTVPSVSKAVTELVTKRFIDEVDGAFVVHDWSDHQFESDSSTDRVRKFRERKRNVSGNGDGNVAATPRAGPRSESESVSESVSVLSDSEQKTLVVSVTPSPGPRWEEYLFIFTAAGKLMNSRDEQKALQAWLSLGLSDQIGAMRSAVELAQTREAQYVPLPVNHLSDKPWTRTGTGRLIPPPAKSKSEIAQREAERRFMNGEYS